uniref:CW domain-containing protein n=1 Tax=Caenorhabditis tropicalis TaxID=1561998 RepID=A0A1I7T0R4_9PELO
MFGLKTYMVPTDPPLIKTETTSLEKQTTTIPVAKFQKLRKQEEDCGKLSFAGTNTIKAGVATSIADISEVTIRATHATTATNCWNLCRYNILSGNEVCTAVGFIEENAQKFINDCYILSESPGNSSGTDTSVDIYEICI